MLGKQFIRPFRFEKNCIPLARFSIPVDVSQHLRFSTDIQMIMRTNKADGAVIYLGEEGHDDVTTYTTIQMLDGKVKGV